MCTQAFPLAIPSPSTSPLRELAPAGARRVKTALVLGSEAGGRGGGLLGFARGEGDGCAALPEPERPAPEVQVAVSARMPGTRATARRGELIQGTTNLCGSMDLGLVAVLGVGGHPAMPCPDGGTDPA